MNQNEWDSLSAKEKKIQLYLVQKNTLDSFVERNAITREQYEKSLKDLTEKMKMQAYKEVVLTKQKSEFMRW